MGPLKYLVRCISSSLEGIKIHMLSVLSERKLCLESLSPKHIVVVTAWFSLL
jgi:hypothetical protein